MAAFHKVEVALNTQSITVGSPSPQTVTVVVPNRGPKGDTGDTGPTGPANSLSIGTVTTGAEGAPAAATITGTAPNQTLDLTIPVGATGATGPQGPAGEQTTDASLLTSGTLADARLSSNVPLKDAANTFTQNQTLNGTNNVAPNQTAASGSSIMTRDLVDARVGDWPAGQTVSVWDNIVYTAGTTSGRHLRGTISLSNNTETKLFNAAVFGTGRIGFNKFSVDNGAGAGVCSLFAASRGNQGDTEINDAANNSAITNSTYWVSFTSAITVTTGDTLSGNVTGATAKVWLNTVLNNTSRTNVWLYDITGIFTSADTDLSLNGTPTGVGVSNSVWGASPAATQHFFFYQTRTDSGTIMPACFQRNGGTRTLFFDIEAV